MTVVPYILAVVVFVLAVAVVTFSAIRSFRAHTATREKALATGVVVDKLNWDVYTYALKKSGWGALWWSSADRTFRAKDLNNPALENTRLAFRECRLWAAVAVAWFVIPLIVAARWWSSLEWPLLLLYCASFLPWAGLFFLFIRALRGWRETTFWDGAQGCSSGTFSYIFSERSARKGRAIGWFVLVVGLTIAYGYFWSQYR